MLKKYYQHSSPTLNYVYIIYRLLISLFFYIYFDEKNLILLEMDLRIQFGKESKFWGLKKDVTTLVNNHNIDFHVTIKISFAKPN